MDAWTLDHLREWALREGVPDGAGRDGDTSEMVRAMVAEWDATPEEEREGLTWPMVLRSVTDRASGIGGDGPAYADGQAFRVHCGRPEAL